MVALKHGWVIALDKSTDKPAMNMDLLGLSIDSLNLTLAISEARWKKIAASLDVMLMEEMIKAIEVS